MAELKLVSPPEDKLSEGRDFCVFGSLFEPWCTVPHVFTFLAYSRCVVNIKRMNSPVPYSLLSALVKGYLHGWKNNHFCSSEAMGLWESYLTLLTLMILGKLLNDYPWSLSFCICKMVKTAILTLRVYMIMPQDNRWGRFGTPLVFSKHTSTCTFTRWKDSLICKRDVQQHILRRCLADGAQLVRRAWLLEKEKHIWPPVWTGSHFSTPLGIGFTWPPAPTVCQHMRLL